MRFASLNILLQCYTRKSNASACHLVAQSIRQCSSKSQEIVEDAVFVVDGGKTILCYHPEKSHPYEHSKEIPNFEPKLQANDSKLKLQYREESEQQLKAPNFPNKLDLQRLTFTTKHVWQKKPGLKYRKPDPPRDREGI